MHKCKKQHDVCSERVRQSVVGLGLEGWAGAVS